MAHWKRRVICDTDDDFDLDDEIWQKKGTEGLPKSHNQERESRKCKPEKPRKKETIDRGKRKKMADIDDDLEEELETNPNAAGFVRHKSRRNVKSPSPAIPPMNQRSSDDRKTKIIRLSDLDSGNQSATATLFLMVLEQLTDHTIKANNIGTGVSGFRSKVLYILLTDGCRNDAGELRYVLAQITSKRDMEKRIIMEKRVLSFKNWAYNPKKNMLFMQKGSGLTVSPRDICEEIRKKLGKADSVPSLKQLICRSRDVDFSHISISKLNVSGIDEYSGANYYVKAFVVKIGETIDTKNTFAGSRYVTEVIIKDGNHMLRDACGFYYWTETGSEEIPLREKCSYEIKGILVKEPVRKESPNHSLHSSTNTQIMLDSSEGRAIVTDLTYDHKLLRTVPAVIRIEELPALTFYAICSDETCPKFRKLESDDSVQSRKYVLECGDCRSTFDGHKPEAFLRCAVSVKFMTRDEETQLWSKETKGAMFQTELSALLTESGVPLKFKWPTYHTAVTTADVEGELSDHIQALLPIIFKGNLCYRPRSTDPIVQATKVERIADKKIAKKLSFVSFPPGVGKISGLEERKKMKKQWVRDHPEDSNNSDRKETECAYRNVDFGSDSDS